MTSILWVEDQSHWIERFKPVLEATDFGGQPTEVTTFKFAEAACQHIRAAKEAPDVALLDAHMGGNSMAGLQVSRALHKRWPGLPILYLSEHSGTDIEQQAFEQSGTMDFIAKHQRNVEAVLCWRIRAVLRQHQHQHSAGQAQDDDTIRSGSLSIDTRTWEVFWHGTRLMNPTNARRPLAPTPRKILRFLVEAAPSPLSTLQIADKLDADPERFSYANYRQHIRTLRRAFDQAEAQPNAFSERCRQGQGIVTFGDEESYCWRPDV